MRKKPDFVFHKQRVVVFVDGCFWHGCPKCYRQPSSNQAFWDAKVARNKARDKAVTRELRARLACHSRVGAPVGATGACREALA